MPPAAQALDVAMHIRSEPEVDPVAAAYEMISLLRSVSPGGAVSARPRQIDSERVVVGSARAGGRTQIIWFCVLSAVRRAVAILGRRAVRQLFDRPRQRLRHRLAQLERRTA